MDGGTFRFHGPHDTFNFTPSWGSSVKGGYERPEAEISMKKLVANFGNLTELDRS
jgi:hypothetical protein